MKTVLIVDDEKNLRMLYKKELLEEGYEIMISVDEILAIDPRFYKDYVRPKFR